MKIHVIDGQENGETDLRAVLDASGVVGTWEWSPPTKTFRLDRGAAALLAGNSDLAGSDLDGTTATARVHPSDVDWLRQDVGRVLQNGGLFLAEFRVVSRDSSLRWVLSRGRIDLDSRGRAIRGRGMLIDITESHDAKQGYVARPTVSAGGGLDQAAALCLQAYEALEHERTPFLRMLVSTALLEIGHELARRLKMKPRYQ